MDWDNKDSIEHFILSCSRKANQGDAAAQLMLGEMYRDGEGVTQSDSTAIYWYEKAANQGSAAAQFNLDLMYLKDREVA